MGSCTRKDTKKTMGDANKIAAPCHNSLKETTSSHEKWRLGKYVEEKFHKMGWQKTTSGRNYVNNWNISKCLEYCKQWKQNILLY